MILYFLLYCPGVSCPVPNTVPHGGFMGRKYQFGAKLVYYCDSGYKLQGVEVLYCTGTGEWSSPQPTCQGIAR